MKKIFPLLIVFIISTGAFPGINVAAKMYKWLDEDGNTHYSQTRPDSDVEIKEIKPPPKVDHEAAQKALEAQKAKLDKLKEERNPSKKEEQDETVSDEDYAQQLKKACESARQSLSSYQRPRVNLKNADGSSRVAAEEERQAGIQKAEAAIKKYCQ